MPGRAVAVAYSGGLDSTALLHATVVAAAPLGASVVALHVHHGLSPHADEWLGHGERLCARWARRGLPVSFVAHRLAGAPPRGESVEAWARTGRYRALREMALANDAELVLLAHHRRDQAETFLLQALRSGGAEALSAMPAIARRQGITWVRPWLQTTRQTIEAYARRHRLRWVEDESNDDPRFARNRLRSQVWPALLAAFPDAEATLAVAASRSQDAAAAVAAWVDVDRDVVIDGAIDIVRWRALPAIRQSGLLRRWLRDAGRTPAPTSLIDRLMAEVPASAPRRWPHSEGEVRSHRGRLRFERRAVETEITGDVDTGGQERSIDLSRPGRHGLAGFGGAFEVRRVRTGGIAVGVARELLVRARRPGDRFQAGPGRPPRSLKLQFQAAGLAAWDRGAPILCHRGSIVLVPGLGVDARAVAAPGELQVSIVWHPG